MRITSAVDGELSSVGVPAGQSSNSPIAVPTNRMKQADLRSTILEPPRAPMGPGAIHAGRSAAASRQCPEDRPAFLDETTIWRLDGASTSGSTGIPGADRLTSMTLGR